MRTYFKSVNKLEKLIPGNIYHIFNKAIGSDRLFINDTDYFYFLQKTERYILPVADIISYCLIPNHFHLLVKIKDFGNLPKDFSIQNIDPSEIYISKVFSNFFNSYSKSFNKAHNRSGRLFLYPFKRILVDDDNYLAFLIVYIHRNPIHHGLVKLFADWKYSSYKTILSNNISKVSREIALAQFDNSKDEFINYHDENICKIGTEKYLLE